MKPISRSKAPAMDGAIQILELLASSNVSLSLSEIAEATDLAYSTTYRLIDSLLLHNMICLDPSQQKKYCMGASIFRLASTVFKRQNSISLFHPISEILKNEVYQSVYLNIEVGNRVVVIAKTESSLAKVSNVYVGSTFVSYEAAAGKAILSTRSEAYQMQYLHNNLPKGLGLASRAKACIMELEQAHRVGYALSENTEKDQLSFIAAPVLDRNNKALASISVGMSKEDFNHRNIRLVATSLIQATRQLSTSLS